MQFPKEFPEKLRSQILTSEVVGKKVKLKLRGKEFTGLCPFHNEKTPSFTVNDQKGFYHCFGCQAHGDIISFVMQSEGLEYRDAVKKLADDFGIEIPKIAYSQNYLQNVSQQEDKLARDHLLLEKICEFFERNLQESQGRAAREYIAKRGISSKDIKKLRLGFAPNSYDALHKNMAALGFTEAELTRSGVIAKNDKGKLYDKFRNRVIFPITDKKNRVIAFGGRVLVAEDMPKYLNSSETEIFKKNQTLYNFFNARSVIFDKKYAVVVEGYMDVISLAINGINNVVAGLGTALGENHLQELFKVTDKIVICLDGDAAGIRAAKRVAEIALPLINSKKNVAFTILPNQLDPDDFIKNFGANELEKRFLSAINLSQALLEFTLLDLNINAKTQFSAEEKAKIEMELFKKIELIRDNISKKYFTQFFRDALFSLGRDFSKNKQIRQGNNPRFADHNSRINGVYATQNDRNLSNFGSLLQKPPIKTNNLADNFAKSIIAFIVKFPQLAHYSDENFDIKEVNFLNEKLTEIKDRVIEIIEENPTIEQEKLLSELENSGFDANIREIANILAAMPEGLFNLDLASIAHKMSLLLLKELLLQVDLQYRQALSNIDEIDTHSSSVNNEKITELFAYRNSLEQKILSIEKDSI